MDVFCEGTATGFDLDGVVAGLARSAGEVRGAELVEVVEIGETFRLAVFGDAGDAGAAARSRLAADGWCGIRGRAID